MLGSMFVASVLFFAVYFGINQILIDSGHLSRQSWNNTLWAAFMVYLALRGILQALCLKKSVYGKC